MGAEVAGKHAARCSSVELWVAAHAIAERGGGKAELLGIDDEGRDLALIERKHCRWTLRGQFVEAVAMNNPCLHSAVATQRDQHLLGKGRIGHANQAAAYPPGVGHRPQQVEHRRNTDLAPRRAGKTKRWVKPRGHAKANTGFFDAAQHSLRRQLDGNSKCFEHIGGAAFRRRSTSAVLAHRNTGAGHDQCRHGGHVDRMAAVATCANNVDGPRAQIFAKRHQRGRPQYCIEQARELFGRFALGAQGNNERNQLRRRSRARKNGGHRLIGIGCWQVFTLKQSGQQRGPSTNIFEM